jgi:hypothetical protein
MNRRCQGFSPAARLLIDRRKAVALILTRSSDADSTPSCFSEWRKTMTPPVLLESVRAGWAGYWVELLDWRLGWISGLWQLG